MKPNLILGSSSPRRRELLQLLVGSSQTIETIPPANFEELCFDDCHTQHTIDDRLRSNVEGKWHDVCQSLAPKTDAVLVCADTIVVVRNQDSGDLVVLGKPPQEPDHKTLRHWFRSYYSGQSHQVITGVRVGPISSPHYKAVSTTISCPEISDEMIDWYIQTQEPFGKAGGYGIQGLGSLFVEHLEGSLTNVIGLPLEFLRSELKF